MSYSKFVSADEFKKILTEVNENTKIEKGGIPLMFDENAIYIEDSINHTLIIDSEGTNKNRNTILPLVKLAIESNENIVISDNNDEVYQKVYEKLKENNYNIVYLNFTDPLKGNAWNPLTIPYNLYKKNDIEASVDYLENVGYYLFTNNESSNDSFWVNSATDLFVGIAFYLFENANEDEVNIQSIFKVVDMGEEIKENDTTYFKYLLSKIPYSNKAYINLSSVLKAPTETRGGILSVFKQMLKRYIVRDNLANQLSYTDFDINNKTAIFIVSNTNTKDVVPLFVEQITELIKNNDTRTNVIINNLVDLQHFKNLPLTLSNAKNNNIKYTLTIPNYLELENAYGKEESSIIELSCHNLIYLISNDLETLNRVSQLCGNNSGKELISSLELKTLLKDEAVVLVPRMMPFKTKLTDDIKWLKDSSDFEIKTREIKEINTYDVNKI